MEKTRNKPKELLPYGMLLTRLFKHVVFISPELAIDHYLSHDRVKHPLAPHYERKTRSDHGKKRPRDSNARSSSTTVNHPSSSRPLDDTIDENDEESFHSNSSSPSQNVSSSSNAIFRVRQNPTHKSQYLNTYLSETINLQTQQQEAHREELRSIGKALKDMMKKICSKFYQLSNHNDDIEKDDDPNDIVDIFMIEGNLFDFETPMCEAFNDFNYLLKIDKDLFNFDIQGTRTYEEYELSNYNGIAKWPTCSSDVGGFCNGGELPGMVRVKSITYFHDHKWYNKLVDGKLKDETLAFKAKVKESWENATLGVMKFCTWLINSFGNFYELDYNVLLKLQECWWKINADVVAPFTHSKTYGHGPYANIKTNWAHDPYLEVNNIIGGNYDISNTQDNQRDEERRDDPTLEPSVCKIRRFEMMKYLFNIDEEYISIQESEYLNHSKDILDAYLELLCIINEGCVVTTTDEEQDGKRSNLKTS
uniref:Uncharacterized protein n=1 Tax=Tanacetum cinerariifolium TaxID=118510 RepID=A0A6L2LV95_TANCI|nr:hypothetical protein [Tanacetum cinerariifolium]